MGTLGYARHQLRKNPSRGHVTRIGTVLIGNSLAFITGSIVLKASMDADLTIRLAQKYERQISFLAPELQMI